MPVLAAAQQQRADLTVVFANQGEDLVALQSYLDTGKLDLGNVVLDSRKGLGRKYGSMTLPTTLFYDTPVDSSPPTPGPLSPASLASKLERLEATAAVEHSSLIP